ncbi:MAG: cell division protein ZapA [Hyphomicrobiales bacterium]|nr:cell division protein ZapA [Hyphomicrobiales bacterium]
MAELEVTVNGKPYTIRCDDGQETHVAQLAEFVNGKVRDLVQSIGQVGDARLLLMAGLLIADELNTACSAESLGKSIVKQLDALADRIEGIAASLEHA